MNLSAADRLRQLGIGPASALETGGAGGETSADRIARSMERLREELARKVIRNPNTALGAEDAAAFLRTAEEGLTRLLQDGASAVLSEAHQIGLEAVIETDGSRPSVAIRDGWIDLSEPRLGDWAAKLTIFETEIRDAIAATARVVINAELSDRSVAGTAVMIGPGLAATAKHVVEQCFTLHEDRWLVPFNTDIALDFHVEAGQPERPQDRIRVRGVKRASPDVIGHAFDPTNLDLAVLELDTEGPLPVPIAPDLTFFPKGPALIHVIGHPKRMYARDNTTQSELEQILELIFGTDFGVKRWSPGQILLGPGQLPADTQTQHLMTHDASTLPGNSGSPVFDLTTTANRLVGLHYGGFFEKQNYAHAGKVFSDWLNGAFK